MVKQKDAKGFAKDLKEDLLKEIEVQLNQLVRTTLNDLTKGVNGSPVSPVLTGFFASSWKASTGEINQTDRRERFPAWAKIRTIYDPSKPPGSKTVLAPGYSPRIKARHYVPKKFRIGESIGIGNTAEYTEEALQSKKSKLIEYILGNGGLDARIDQIFSDKNRPRLSIKAEGGGAPYQDL